jgi:hypothetical protein
MPFNFKKYTSNNPLLQEYISDKEYDYMNDDEIKAAEKAGQLNPSDPSSDTDVKENKYPRAEFADAVYKALQAGLDKDELCRIVNFGG